jgi:hypothetical protein
MKYTQCNGIVSLLTNFLACVSAEIKLRTTYSKRYILLLIQEPHLDFWDAMMMMMMMMIMMMRRRRRRSSRRMKKKKKTLIITATTNVSINVRFKSSCY